MAVLQASPVRLERLDAPDLDGPGGSLLWHAAEFSGGRGAEMAAALVSAGATVALEAINTVVHRRRNVDVLAALLQVSGRRRGRGCREAPA